MAEQIIITKKAFTKELHNKVVFLVCGSSFLRSDFYQDIKDLPQKMVVFSDFKPNPDISSVEKGITIFCKSKADLILAAGGGSAMDVAKAIKGYADREGEAIDVNQPMIPNDIPLIAIPTTAGSGSEATHFAVIYKNGVKLSIADHSLLPAKVLLIPEILDSLPLYQRKTTLLDALCHAIESFWSVKSTEESRKMASKAIKLILNNKEGYLNNTVTGNEGMLLGSNLAGSAINITQTTAAHAMSYKLTTLFGISHGHAVALCLKELWPYMWEHREGCTDCRGLAFLENIFLEIAHALGAATVEEGITVFVNIMNELELEIPEINQQELEILVDAVNIQRLSNNPVPLEKAAIRKIYQSL